MPNDDTGAGNGLATTWPGLSQLQQLIHTTKLGVRTLDTLISTPSAASATGSPPASLAIVALGVQLAIFLGQTIDAMDDDIDNLRRTAENYRLTEADVVTGIASIIVAVTGGSTATTPGSPTPTTTPTTTTTTTVPAATRPRVVPSGTRERIATVSGATR